MWGKLGAAVRQRRLRGDSALRGDMFGAEGRGRLSEGIKDRIQADEIERPGAKERATSTTKDEVFALKEMKGRHTEKEHTEEVRLLETIDRPLSAQPRAQLLGGVALVCLLALGAYYRLPGLRRKSEN